MENHKDAYGQQLRAQLNGGGLTAELIERDDEFIDTGSEAGLYFSAYEDWPPIEQQAIAVAKGKVLDIGCGAGRHSLYLQEKGLEVTAIDYSPGAVEVCRLRGVKNAIVCPIGDIGRFEPGSFDTIVMLGNNFGLFGDPQNAKRLLEEMARITSPAARIIAGTRDPYQTDDPVHLGYHDLNRQRGRMPGQIRMRVRYRKAVGEWFDYLFVSQDEMSAIVDETDWKITEFLTSEKEANYLAVLQRR